MRAMQTLRLSESTAQPDNRLKSLFWPSVETSNDVDYLGSQGYWVCAIVGVLTCVAAAVQGHWISGLAGFLFYYLGGVGVRERSRYAATVVLVLFVGDFIAGVVLAGPAAVGPGIGVVRLLLTAVLISNLRATWIASRWKPDSDEAALPPRFGVTWGEKFADRLPMWLWPKIRILYYIFSVSFLAMVAVGVAILALRHAR